MSITSSSLNSSGGDIPLRNSREERNEVRDWMYSVLEKKRINRHAARQMDAKTLLLKDIESFTKCQLFPLDGRPVRGFFVRVASMHPAPHAAMLNSLPVYEIRLQYPALIPRYTSIPADEGPVVAVIGVYLTKHIKFEVCHHILTDNPDELPPGLMAEPYEIKPPDRTRYLPSAFIWKGKPSLERIAQFILYNFSQLEDSGGRLDLWEKARLICERIGSGTWDGEDLTDELLDTLFTIATAPAMELLNMVFDHPRPRRKGEVEPAEPSWKCPEEPELTLDDLIRLDAEKALRQPTFF